MRKLRNQNNISLDYFCVNEFTDIGFHSVEPYSICNDGKDIGQRELSDIKAMINRHSVPTGKLARMFHRCPWVINKIKNNK